MISIAGGDQVDEPDGGEEYHDESDPVRPEQPEFGRIGNDEGYHAIEPVRQDDREAHVSHAQGPCLLLPKANGPDEHPHADGQASQQDREDHRGRSRERPPQRGRQQHEHVVRGTKHDSNDASN